MIPKQRLNWSSEVKKASTPILLYIFHINQSSHYLNSIKQNKQPSSISELEYSHEKWGPVQSQAHILYKDCWRAILITSTQTSISCRTISIDICSSWRIRILGGAIEAEKFVSILVDITRHTQYATFHVLPFLHHNNHSMQRSNNYIGIAQICSFTELKFLLKCSFKSANQRKFLSHKALILPYCI